MAMQLSPPTLGLKDALEYYENGKHRRYTLLFAVNGGAFTVAKLLLQRDGDPEVVLGNLTLQQLSIGMAVFTAVMVWDIFDFGRHFATTYLEHTFRGPGRAVLFLLGALQILGWLLVGVIR